MVAAIATIHGGLIVRSGLLGTIIILAVLALASSASGGPCG